MSTRRARIKAVASLPVRRKNLEVIDNSKIKETIKEEGLKDKKPQSSTSTSERRVSVELRTSPVIKASIAVPVEGPLVIASTSPKESQPCDTRVSVVEGTPPPSTPPRVEKVSVITPNVNYKRSSPARDDFASPTIPSPKAAKCTSVIVQGPSTPRKLKTPSAHTLDEHNELQISSKNVNSVVYNSVSSKSAVSDDYNVPSVPDSIETDGVMDGIVPLQPESTPKPIDQLKSEIISENAEVLFDPIIPLPSPSKVRPKLRPTPRLGPHRRNSVQGSASESEDESRRALLGGANTPGAGRQRHDSHTAASSSLNKNISRKRNDSVCSSISQTNPSSPSRDKMSSKNRRREISRRMAAMRRRNETVEREKLTMYDLIFYNPTTNPIVPNSDEVQAKRENMKEEKMAKKAKEDNKEKKTEEKEVEIEEETEEDKTEESPAADAAPVPQIKLGPNGEIVLDKSSLVITQTDAKREVSSTVREGSWVGGGGKYTRAPRTAEWSACETVRFYRALAALGTDFSLMAQLFPDRNRRELKQKFKKEERINSAQVDKTLRAGNSWDPSQLKQEFQDERAEDARRAKREKEKLKLARIAERERMKTLRERRVRNSRASKALQCTNLPGVSKKKEDITSVDDLVHRALEVSKKKKKAKKTLEEPTTPLDENTNTMATLTLLSDGQVRNSEPKVCNGMATLSRITPTSESSSPINLNTVPNVPSNIETGSLVVLTVNDPLSPSKKMLQTYIANSSGKLTPVSLPPTFLNSVVGYMKKGTPKSTVSSNSSPQFMSPSSVASVESRTGVATPVSNSNPSPVKRKRMSSYTITQL